MYYKDPQFGMNELVYDKGSLEITDLYRVHHIVHVYIKHSLSQPEYCDGPVEEPENIVDEMEELLNKLHDDNEGKLKESVVGVDEVNDGLNDPSVVVEQSNVRLNDANVGVEATNVKVEHVEVESNTDGQVHDESNSYDSEDESYQYDSALEVALDDESDGYEDIDENEIADMTVYDSNEISKGKGKGKGKCRKDTEEYKGRDNDSEDLQSGCDSDDSSGVKRNKYPIFKEIKDMANYKWELGMYFTSKDDIKEEIYSYAVQNGRALNTIKNDKKRMRVRCKEGCEWEVYFSKLLNEETWKIRKVTDNHNCSREYNVRMHYKKNDRLGRLFWLITTVKTVAIYTLRR
ncbi:unnamed protein product [Vicia faba]|uniref:Transposase MuDR plant domain-containing protein n=1 Tax=Vicia faba TaxID=3906 RepID=A0AAV1AVD2_VICFA|nr:unnamed protein product [Vicia faba]